MKTDKILLIEICIVLVSFVPAVFVCFKSMEAFEVFLTNGAVANNFESFAKKASEGLLSNEQISDKFLALAAADRQVEQGIMTTIESFYIYVFAFFFIAILQFLLVKLLRRLV